MLLYEYMPENLRILMRCECMLKNMRTFVLEFGVGSISRTFVLEFVVGSILRQEFENDSISFIGPYLRNEIVTMSVCEDRLSEIIGSGAMEGGLHKPGWTS